MGDDCPKENTGTALTDLQDPGTPSYEPEAKKAKIETIEIADSDNDSSKDQLSALTPSRKPRTPKISKEEREAALQKKLELRRQKEEEKRQKEEERLRAKERLAEEKRLEREKKEKEREEKRKEEEARKAEAEKAKEEKREAKRKEEEEKQKKKDEQLQRKKEEEEQKRREEEAETEKKKRASARFIGFFKKVEKEPFPPEKVDDQQELWYRAFEVKPGMTIAPIHRRPILVGDENLVIQNPDVSYLSSENVKNRKLTTATQNELKTKLFQFHDNYRPPYYGTWRKVDPSLSGRRPNKPSSDDIDYTVDSDAEWEDEPSDAEECKSDEEDPDVEEVDSEGEGDFYVEHGYLSDGEGQDEEGDPLEDRDAEGRAKRLAARASEWKRNVLNKPKVLNTVCVGPALTPSAAELLASPAVVIP